LELSIKKTLAIFTAIFVKKLWNFENKGQPNLPNGQIGVRTAMLENFRN